MSSIFSTFDTVNAFREHETTMMQPSRRVFISKRFKEEHAQSAYMRIRYQNSVTHLFYAFNECGEVIKHAENRNFDLCNIADLEELYYARPHPSLHVNIAIERAMSLIAANYFED